MKLSNKFFHIFYLLSLIFYLKIAYQNRLMSDKEVNMNILIANDDGYAAPGIIALSKRLSAEHNVVVVAPDGERSGYSHMVNFFGGITYRKVETDSGIETYAVDGSPADCVIFAIKHLFKERSFDVVLSGINSVLNIGSDIIYSGTFGAAQEGTFHRLPSIAVSLRTHGGEDYAFAADFIAENLEKLMTYAVENVTLSVNIPCTKREDIAGVRVAPITYRPYDEKYFSVKDESGKDVYYIDGHSLKTYKRDENGDCALCEKGYITVTPMQMLGTDFDTLRAMRSAEFKL